MNNGYHQGVYEYDIAGTPCAPVIESQKLIHVPERLIELYPGDPDLQPLGAVSYMGIALLDTDARQMRHERGGGHQPQPEDLRDDDHGRAREGRHLCHRDW